MVREVVYKIFDKASISTEIANIFISMLKKQGKVEPPTIEKIKACRQVVLCYSDRILVGIGAIKTKTKSDFSINKSDLGNLEKKFAWELGYFYIEEKYRKLGIASTIAKLLMFDKQDENILASTELFNDNSMIRILAKYGFKQYGKPWNSRLP